MNHEHLFAQLKKIVALSATEKAASRERLAAYLAEHPAPTPVPSMVFAFTRYAVAFVVMLAVTGTGVAFAAENANPGDALYVVRVRVTEPTRVALTRDPEKRADLEVALVDKRLKELAQVSVDQTKNGDTTDLIVRSLSDRLEDAHKDIEKLTEGRSFAALDAASELRATLSVHAEILERVSELDTDAAEDVEVVVAAVASSTLALEETEEEIETATMMMKVDETAVTEAIESEEEQANEALADIAEDVNAAKVDVDDADSLEGALEQIQAIFEAAQDKRDGGDSREALRLYGEANEQTTRLKTLIEAETDLGIDFFD